MFVHFGGGTFVAFRRVVEMKSKKQKGEFKITMSFS